MKPKATKSNWKSEALRIALLVILYVLIGNARSVELNPFIPGAVVAVNMVVPVLAGALFGARTGFLVGTIGTLLNGVVYDISGTQGSIFEYLAILPHGVMGLVAGYLKRWLPTFLIAGSLIVGHILDITAFSMYGIVPTSLLYGPSLWFAIAYETFVGIITVTVLAAVYRIGFERLK